MNRILLGFIVGIIFGVLDVLLMDADFFSEFC